ncbi:MAG: hypothetical protein IPK00_07210 [Deltaproteobacteria bacterium]|nr:hypothetical protein [Deltaproteobacteria bacterium]
MSRAETPQERDSAGVADSGANASLASRVGSGIGPLAALAVGLATVVLVGQPIYANDTWIHLALGRAFAAEGPWLAADPYLFAAPGPPSPSSWLGSAAIFGIWSTTGFDGLRLVHGLLVLGILVLAWHVLRRAGASAALAGAGVVGFVVLATYRLVQLRPDLFTMVATLALFPLLVADRSGPDGRRIAAAALLAAVWSNVHAAFVLGPVLVLAASAAVAVATWIPRRSTAEIEDGNRTAERKRALRLGLAGAAMAIASLANPQGPSAHLAYLESGRETLDLAAISDEWNPTDLFAWPVPFLPPTIAAWLLCWLGVVGLTVAIGLFLRERRRGRAESVGAIDPALLALAGAGLFAAVRASRFLWLGIFVLALLGSILCRRGRAELVAWTGAAFAVGAAALHFSVGDWPLVSRSLRADAVDYAVPYSAERFNSEAIWFLADTGVEGRIYNDYPLGGFMSFWLAPRLQMASSGTMNVAKEAMEANLAIGARRTLRADEDFAALLDRMGYDLFLGLGFPVEARPGRPVPCTVRHLERESGWLLVFRNLRNAVYLRDDARNAKNLDRIVAYYQRAGVPFDRERGFEAERVVRKATPWALEHGLIPFDFEALVEHVREARRAGRVDGQVHRLAVLYATLGLYERAIQLDRFVQKAERADPVSAWRLLWCLLQLGRLDDALELATELDRKSEGGTATGAGAWSAPIESLVRADPASRAAQIALLPMLRTEQIDWVRYGIAIAPARYRLDDSSGAR